MAILLLKPHLREVGANQVRRLLPAAQRQAVGPFLFFDHFGPVDIAPDSDRGIGPHPHIGLATVTYLFEGGFLHRDSLGSVQRIDPGAINWMTAGRGIVHAERTPPELVGKRHRGHGLQLWAGLPKTQERSEPAFSHTPAAALPALGVGDAQVRLLIGRAWGAESPVATFTETLYADLELRAPGELRVPPLAAERALYSVDNPFAIDGTPCEPRVMAILETGTTARVTAAGPARMVLIGGEPLDGHRFMWWNFVASRKEWIAEAADLWAKQEMGKIAGETEWIPLPERGFK